MKLRRSVLLVLLFVPLLLFAQYQPVDKLGKIVYVEAEFTRAANNTAFDGNDVFSVGEDFATAQYLKFLNVVKYPRYSGYIEAYSIWLDTSSTVQMQLLLFPDTTSLSPQYNAFPYAETWTKRHYEIARTDTINVIKRDILFARAHVSCSIPFVAKTTDLYGLLTVMGGVSTYTAKWSGKVRVGLWIRRN